MEKKLVRQQIMKDLQALDPLLYQDFSYQISQRLLATEEWKKAQTIGITVSQFPEVDTWQIIRMAWRQGKVIAIPKCNPVQKTMLFYPINAFAQMEKGYAGLFEPLEAGKKPISKQKLDLLLVPGLGFTKEGYRLGFGGGYYDRFLINYHGHTIALAFTNQLQDKIPIEKYDLPVQQIVTENQIIHCEPTKFA
ncbi:5-formyltetrahydrofolate cyclo-ligase [Lederbergia sp. NSJ-179]|uniref:5-formyltetrahydrofolate cyclo-ligase n=1 Tax=Lederbergia sp. NSJ-179 TaxID=2931402 RepID=UPI001FD04472|nr:5-formyltetrahydrofolate cyclo-ligase [Lederbergia sp. NSJ-179]MCJ7843413.1 5-formyltetrahydrofolate cyclo-ligase [Lederbergia sp. NSJ-179]